MHEVQTVRGPVAGTELGLVLPHEHLFNDLSSMLAEPAYASTAALRGRQVGPQLQYLLRQDPYCCLDNVSAKDPADVAAEVEAFAASGGATIVDATGSPRIGRDPARLLALSEATGVNIVMGTGAYLEKFEAERITDRAVDEQVAAILADLDQGVDGTGIRAGMIGEVGISPSYTQGEHASLVAACVAQADSPHAAVNIHMPGWQRRGHEVLDTVLDEFGVSPGKVALAHSDPSGEDAGYQHSLLERGVFLEFDMIGLDISFPGEGASPSVAATAAAVAGLIEAGYQDQLLLSHDLFLKQMWRANGGNGLSFVPTVFTDLLRAHGIDEGTVAGLTSNNPARWLAGRDA